MYIAVTCHSDSVTLQVVPLPCTHSLARKDVSYSCLRGAKAPVMAQRRLNISACAPAVRCLNRSLLYRVWRLPFPLDSIHAHAVHLSLPTRIQLPHVGRTLGGGQVCVCVRLILIHLTTQTVALMWL